MLRSLFFLFILVITFVQCKGPTALFLIEEDTLVAPANIIGANKSRNDENFIWKLDGVELSQSEDLLHTILESGAYELELCAYKNNNFDCTAQKVNVAAPQNCIVYINTTVGVMTFELFEETPGHLINFVDLVEQEYYNGLAFHRVINDFVIQIGDNATRLADEDFEVKKQIPKEINTDRIHIKGALAAARMPDNVNPEKASSGTQFFIVDGRELNLEDIENYEAAKATDYSEGQIEAYLKHGGAPQLDEEYSVFGILMSGVEVLEAISSVLTDENQKPIENIRILDMKFIN